MSNVVVFRSALASLLLMMGGCATAPGPSATPELVISRSDQLTLTSEDYRAMLAAQPREVLAVNADSAERMRELVLDLHSDAVLARQAEAEGLDRAPLIAAQLAEARRRILSNALLLKTRDAVQIPEDLSVLKQERYLREKPRLLTLEGRKVAHILLTDLVGCPCKVEPLAERAAALHKELLAGADFAEAARKYSMDGGSAVDGGVLPALIHRDGKTVRSFEEEVFALKKPGDISTPFRSQYGVHIVKLLEIEPSRQLSYEDVEQSLSDQVVGSLRFNAMEQLRGSAYPDPTQLNLEALQTVLRELMPNAPSVPTAARKPQAN